MNDYSSFNSDYLTNELISVYLGDDVDCTNDDNYDAYITINDINVNNSIFSENIIDIYLIDYLTNYKMNISNVYYNNVHFTGSKYFFMLQLEDWYSWLSYRFEILRVYISNVYINQRYNDYGYNNNVSSYSAYFNLQNILFIIYQ